MPDHRFIDQLEDAFSLVLMVQFLTSSIVICVVLYQLTLVSRNDRNRSLKAHVTNFLASYSQAFGWNEETIKTITYLPGAVLQLYVFCWYAQKITEEAELVANHIYSIPWYLGDPAYEKMCITLMAKAQKPAGVTASKFYMITLQSFQRVSMWRAFSRCSLEFKLLFGHSRSSVHPIPTSLCFRP